jgi:hypothetical protein
MLGRVVKTIHILRYLHDSEIIWPGWRSGSISLPPGLDGVTAVSTTKPHCRSESPAGQRRPHVLRFHAVAAM